MVNRKGVQVLGLDLAERKRRYEKKKRQMIRAFRTDQLFWHREFQEYLRECAQEFAYVMMGTRAPRSWIVDFFNARVKKHKYVEKPEIVVPKGELVGIGDEWDRLRVELLPYVECGNLEALRIDSFEIGLVWEIPRSCRRPLMAWDIRTFGELLQMSGEDLLKVRKITPEIIWEMVVTLSAMLGRLRVQLRDFVVQETGAFEQVTH